MPAITLKTLVTDRPTLAIVLLIVLVTDQVTTPGITLVTVLAIALVIILVTVTATALEIILVTTLVTVTATALAIAGVIPQPMAALVAPLVGKQTLASLFENSVLQYWIKGRQAIQL